MEAVESFVEVLAENPDKDFILRGDFMSWENNTIVCVSERKLGSESSFSKNDLESQKRNWFSEMLLPSNEMSCCT